MADWDELRGYTLDGVIRRILEENTGAVETGAIADKVVAHLWQSMLGGEEWAVAVIRPRLREGVRRRVYQLVKDDRGVIRIAHTGQVIDMPTYFGVPVKVQSDEDGERPPRQLALWWEMTWDTLIEVIARLARQRRILARDVKAFTEVLKLREEFPDSCTPGEACMLAGVNPKDFELSETLTV